MVPDTGREGYCWTSSIAVPRGDAWRCMEGNAIHDPCFTLPGGQAVACGADPAKQYPGFVLRLNKPLPPPDTQHLPPRNNWAWLIELDDGTLCQPFTGTRALIGGEIAVSGCAPGGNIHAVLLGDLDNQKPLWTARKATFLQLGSKLKLKLKKTVPLKAVWQ